MMTGRVVKGAHEPRPFVERAEIVLKIDKPNRVGEFSDVSFVLHKGEILGVAG